MLQHPTILVRLVVRSLTVAAMLAIGSVGGAVAAHAQAASGKPPQTSVHFTHHSSVRVSLSQANCDALLAQMPQLTASDCYVTIVSSWTDPVALTNSRSTGMGSGRTIQYDNQCATLNETREETYYGVARAWQTSQIATFAFSSAGCFQPYVVSGTHRCGMDDYVTYPQMLQINDCTVYPASGGDQVVAEEDFQEGTYVFTSSDWMRITCDKFGNLSTSSH